MTTVPPDLNVLRTDEDIRMRAMDLIGCAIREQLWVLFLDADERELPILMPIERLPLRASAEGCAALARAFGRVAEASDAAAVVLIRERPGTPFENVRDREWSEHLRQAFADIAVPIRAMLLSSDAGVEAFRS